MKNHNAMDHSAMNHPADGGPAPANMTAAPAPTFPVGSKVSLATDHMAGMHGAVGTVEASTNETVYMVDYVADGMTMTNHKWVVESEIAPLAAA